MNGEMIQVQLVGADIPATVDQLCNKGIVLYDVQYDGLLCATLNVPYGQYKLLKHLAEKSGNEVKLRRIQSLVYILKNFLKRPVLVIGLLYILLMSLWLPGRVLFISVEGNQTIPITRILQEAEQCGVCFGAKRGDVRSEIVKNHLLEAMPELRWAGITTDGCTAIIRVLEEPKQETKIEPIAYSSIVAACDGIVTSCTVTSGSAACSVGDAVKKGQLLISGYQDMGLLVKLSRSQGEVFAQTERDISLITPLNYAKKGQISAHKTRYSLIIGKNRINLSKGSGIFDTSCDKIYKQYFLTLPGGFVLPAAIEVEQIINHHQSVESRQPEHMQGHMEAQADSYLSAHTVSGTIKARTVSDASAEQVYHMTVHYTCVEMIGREQTEEIKIQYGKSG